MKNPTPKITIVLSSLLMSACSLVADVAVDSGIDNEPLQEAPRVQQINEGGDSYVLDEGLVELPAETMISVQGPDLLDGQGGIDSGSLVPTPVIDIQPVVDPNNTPPVVAPDLYIVKEDKSLVMNALLGNDIDKDGDSLSIIGVSPASNHGGTLWLSFNGDVLYIPKADFYGEDFFTYTISDGRGGAATGKVTVQVESVDDIPVAKVDMIAATQSKAVTYNVVQNDESVGDSVQLSIVTAPTYGAVLVGMNGEVTYTPAGDYFGADSFVYKIVDTDGDESIASVSVDVACVSGCQKTFKLSWDASVSTNVVGYKVYIGSAADSLDQVVELGDTLQYDHVVDAKGDYYFAVAAVSDQQIESDLSTVETAVF